MNGTSTNGTTPHANGATKSAICSVDEFVAQTYDYIVVGGGTAGLVVAARLTENFDVTVGVIEAGKDRTSDELILTPSAFPAMIGNKDYDWCWKSTPQPNAGNHVFDMPRGKTLGGSSAINYLFYVRGSKNDYRWDATGNKDWGWDSLLPYFKKHQTLDPNTCDLLDPTFMPDAGKDKYHGSKGPIHTSFNNYHMPLEEDYVKAAYETTGTTNTLTDAWGGDHLGFFSSLAVVDRTKGVGQRSYSANGYLKPNLHRPNLKVLTEALASKIILEQGTAKRVEFIHDGNHHQVSANREVVLCLGTVQTPQLLELSGIGDPKILDKIGVPCQIESPRVGANFQDHVLTGVVYELAPGIISMDSLIDPEVAKQQREIYTSTQGGMYGNPGMLMGFLSYASLVDQKELQATIDQIRATSLAETEFEKAQEEVIVQQLSDPLFANLQTFCLPYDAQPVLDLTTTYGTPIEKTKNRICFLICLEHPLSRGSIHAVSADPTAAPQIDPGYFRNPVDLKIVAAGIKWLEQVAAKPILQKSLGSRVLPNKSFSLESGEDRMEYIRHNMSTQYHLIGTAAMGEVVDDELRVKGARGLRVVDASIFPAHISGNTLATVYAIAEKGADLIKKSDGRF